MVGRYQQEVASTDFPGSQEAAAPSFRETCVAKFDKIEAWGRDRMAGVSDDIRQQSTALQHTLVDLVKGAVEEQSRKGEAVCHYLPVKFWACLPLGLHQAFKDNHHLCSASWQGYVAASQCPLCKPLCVNMYHMITKCIAHTLLSIQHSTPCHAQAGIVLDKI